jgi:hypothetical protein
MSGTDNSIWLVRPKGMTGCTMIEAYASQKRKPVKDTLTGKEYNNGKIQKTW